MKKALLLILVLPLLLARPALKSLFERKPVSLHLRVERGASTKEVLKELEPEGALDSALLYLWARLTGIRVKEGCYDVKGFLSPVEVVKVLTRGTPCMVKVTIPEGSDLFDVDRILSGHGICKEGEVLELAQDRKFLTELRVPWLEGYIHPETYFVRENTTCAEFLKTAVHLFKERVNSLLHRYTPPESVKGALKTVTAEKLLILASIVEKETHLSRERPLVASVLYNRLRKNMKLQCDPTVVYAYKLLRVKKDRLSRKDLKLKSPYNTYLFRGLPPSPICNPSLESIKAVMYPSSSPYLYFVASGNGHIFSKSYAKHLENIKRLRRHGKAVRN